MIIKLAGNEDEWVFIGEIVECAHKVIICETESGNEELQKKFEKKDFSDPRPWGNATEFKKLKLLSYIRKGQEAEFVLFDRDAYLLSETGKTIERF